MNLTQSIILILLLFPIKPPRNLKQTNPKILNSPLFFFFYIFFFLFYVFFFYVFFFFFFIFFFYVFFFFFIFFFLKLNPNQFPHTSTPFTPKNLKIRKNILFHNFANKHPRKNINNFVKRNFYKLPFKSAKFPSWIPYTNFVLLQIYAT